MHKLSLGNKSILSKGVCISLDCWNFKKIHRTCWVGVLWTAEIVKKSKSKPEKKLSRGCPTQRAFWIFSGHYWCGSLSLKKVTEYCTQKGHHEDCWNCKKKSKSKSEKKLSRGCPTQRAFLIFILLSGHYWCGSLKLHSKGSSWPQTFCHSKRHNVSVTLTRYMFLPKEWCDGVLCFPFHLSKLNFIHSSIHLYAFRMLPPAPASTDV